MTSKRHKPEEVVANLQQDGERSVFLEVRRWSAPTPTSSGTATAPACRRRKAKASGASAI